jgi:hypothetical protein
MAHPFQTPPAPMIPADRRNEPFDRTRATGDATWTRSMSTAVGPVYRRGRRRFALHFGPATGEAHYPGRGLAAVPPEVTLFACLITPDAGLEQRPLATSSRGGGLVLAIKRGTLQLFQAGAGWVDSLIPCPAGSWVVCAVARHEARQSADFFLFDCDSRVFRRRTAVAVGRGDAGDGVLTLNSRSGGAFFTGAISAAGLVPEVWSEHHFRRLLARLFGESGGLTRTAGLGVRGCTGASGGEAAGCPVAGPRHQAPPASGRLERNPVPC